MSASRDTLATIAATVAERVDRAEPRSRHDLELAVLVLEDLSDEFDGWPLGTTPARLGSPLDEPTVLLLRRLANAHHRLAVADRRCELPEATDARIRALSARLRDGGAPDRVELTALVPAVC